MDLIKPESLISGFVVLFIIYFFYQRSGKQTQSALGNNVVLTVFNQSKKKILNLLGLTGGQKKGLDFTAGAAIDLNNTGEKAIFIGRGRGQHDLLLVNRGGRLVNIIDQTNLSDPAAATYSAVSADLDHNGYTDLVVGRENGVFLYLNHKKGRFEQRKLIPGHPAIMPTSLAITDYNKDGHVDIYVSQYAHPELGPKGAVARNVLLEGIGRGVFEDVAGRTRTAGDGNTISAAWVDLDGDKLPDLVLAQDGGEIEIYQNTRGASGVKFTSQNKFYRMHVPTGVGYWRSISTGDIDNDGDPDLLLSGVGTGGVQQVVLRNDGHFKFTQVSGEKVKRDLNDGWKAIMEDLNLDGRQEILTGRAGDSGMAVDLDSDGVKDMVWINSTGPQKIYSNLTQDQNWIGVQLPDGVPFLNATVQVVSVDDHSGKIRKQVKQNTTGSGIGNDPSRILTFGLGKDTRVLRLEVYTIYDGNHWIHPRPMINMIATFRNMKSNYYTAKSRDENGQLPLNKSAILGQHQF